MLLFSLDYIFVWLHLSSLRYDCDFLNFFEIWLIYKKKKTGSAWLLSCCLRSDLSHLLCCLTVLPKWPARCWWGIKKQNWLFSPFLDIWLLSCCLWSIFIFFDVWLPFLNIHIWWWCIGRVSDVWLTFLILCLEMWLNSSWLVFCLPIFAASWPSGTSHPFNYFKL